MTKLCPRGKAAAKRKFKVYPSAYANAYASKICAGKIKDPSGVKRKDFRGPKPTGKKDGGTVERPTTPGKAGGKINRPKSIAPTKMKFDSSKRSRPKFKSEGPKFKSGGLAKKGRGCEIR